MGGKIANVADATSVTRPDTLYFGTLYISRLCIYKFYTRAAMFMQLLTFKTRIWYNKAKPITECLRYFRLQKYRHCTSVKKVLPTHSMVFFGLFYFQEKFEKSIIM